MITAIQHVPTEERAANVEVLKEALSGWGDAVHVITDAEKRGPRWSWAAALRSADNQRLLTLQDDVALTAPLSVLDGLVKLRPHDIICLYYARKSAPEMAAKGYRWFSTYDVWTLGVIYPPNLTERIANWQEKHIPQEYRHDDRALSAYLTHHAMPAFGPVPSVVQHLDFVSTMGHGRLPQKRNAHLSWSPGTDYSNLADFRHSGHRWTVAEIKGLTK